MSKKLEDRLKFYVLNYDFNRKKIINYNIFNNIRVKQSTIDLVKQYKSNKINSFDEFVEELKHIVQWQEWSRREYEISVSDAFTTDLDKYEKWDCYSQFEPNAEIVAHYILSE